MFINQLKLITFSKTKLKRRDNEVIFQNFTLFQIENTDILLFVPQTEFLKRTVVNRTYPFLNAISYILLNYR